jgi:hypothetical protein
MTPGTKCGGGAEIDKHSAENDKNRTENDEIEVPKKSAEKGGNLRQYPSKKWESNIPWRKFRLHYKSIHLRF